MHVRDSYLSLTCAHRLVAMVALATMAACSGDSTAPVPGPPFKPVVLSLQVTPSSAIMSLADTQTLSAAKVMSTGLLIPVQATWVSDNPAIVTVDADGHAVAVGVGRATISALADGMSGSSALLVTRPVVISDALVVEEFTMIEHQYPSNPGYWYYAPHFKMRGTSARAVTVLALDFIIPRIGDWRFGCGAVVSAEEGVVFNGAAYGDWAFELHGGTDRAGSDSVRLDITLLDERNDVVNHTVFGQVFAGGFPAADERLDSNSCFRRYRP